jgi:hypothetical protein
VEQVDAISRTDSTRTFCALDDEDDALVPAAPLLERVAPLALELPVADVPVLDVPDVEPYPVDDELLDSRRPRISTS